MLVVKGRLWGEAGGHFTNNTITIILNFIHQWLGNYWCWRCDYPERLETTLQYTKFHLSMARQLLMLKMTIWGVWRPLYNILNFIYHWLGNCWWWRGGYWGRLEATFQYSNFHLSLTGQLLGVKGWLLGEAGGHLTISTITNIRNFTYQWLGICWCWRGDYPGRVEVALQYTNFHLSLTGQLWVGEGVAIGGAPSNILNWYTVDKVTVTTEELLLRSLEAIFTRQLLVVKGWLLGEVGGHLPIF